MLEYVHDFYMDLQDEAYEIREKVRHDLIEEEEEVRKQQFELDGIDYNTYKKIGGIKK